MKKNVYFILAGFFSLLLIMNLVSAATSDMMTNLGDGVKTAYDSVVMPIAKWIIGEQAAENPENFFTLILLFILLISVLWAVTTRIPLLGEYTWVQFIISFAVSVISIRFLGLTENTEWFKAILLPNHVLGVAILCVLPLVVYVFFVESVGEGKPILRKVLFLLGAVVFIMIYLTRYDEFSKMDTGGFLLNPVNIYLYATLASLVLLFADGTISGLWHKAKTESYLAEGKNKIARQLLKDLSDLDEAYAAGRIDRAGYKKESDELKKRYEHLKAGT